MFEPPVFTAQMKHETMTREMRETFTESNSTWGPQKKKNSTFGQQKYFPLVHPSASGEAGQL